MDHSRRVLRLSLLLAIAAVLPGAGRAQTAPEAKGYRAYVSFAQEMEKLGQQDRCTVRSLGKTAGGRDILVATVGTGEADGKPAILVVGSVHASHLLGSYLTLEMAKRLVADDEAAAILEGTTFYFIPRPSPDATERNFEAPHREVTWNLRPHDDDRDDLVDEDGPDDLNGDGRITQMRVKDPSGEWMPHPDDPRILIRADRTKDEKGVFRIYSEGRDDDGDERWNEDPIGGVDFNRNLTHNYPSFQSGAGPHAVSEPESRAVLDFAFDRRNIAAVFCFTPDGNLDHVWKSNPQADGRKIKTTLLSKDAPYLEHLAEAYRDLHEQKGAPRPGKAAGAFLEWAYFHFGRWAFATRGWWVPEPAGKGEEEGEPGKPEDDKEEIEGDTEEPDDPETEGGVEEAPKTEDPEGEEEGKPGQEKPEEGAKEKKKEEKRGAEEVKALKWLEENGYPGFVEWEKVEHPDFPGKEVEVGGFFPRCRLNPSVELAEKLVEPNLKMLKLLAGRLPRLELVRDRVEDLGEGLFRIRVRLVNDGFLRTESQMGAASRQLQWLQVEMEIPEGAVLLTPPARRSLGALEGNGGKSEQVWLVRFGKVVPESVPVRAWAPHVGEAHLDVKLEVGQ